MTLLVFYVLLALGVSFLCSIMEAVLLSVTPSFVARMQAERGVVGRKLADLKRNIDRPLAAILSLNTIAHTVGAAGAGAQAAIVFGNTYVGIASAILTFLILVVSEIIPKTLGTLYWRQLAASVVRILVPTIWLMWPLVKMAEGLTWILARGRAKVIIRREEFQALADVGVREGVLHERESHILQSLLRFGDLTARDIITPRTVVFALPADSTVADVMEEYREIRFSRIPVYGEDKDRVLGFVLKNDILLHAARDQGHVALNSFMHPITAVPHSIPLQDLFEQLIEDRAHVAIVVDEYGGLSGLVTLEDAVETLLGLEIIDEVDTVDDMQRYAREKWQTRAKKMGITIPGRTEDGESK
ncbi:MAG: HlyC/CorC family transporter [Rhodothermales bacterium]|nr:HlyC/CorC family transporter [Rhodothermales bacterium]